MEEKWRPKCPRCDSTQVYFRLMREEFICRRCGYIWKEREKRLDDNVSLG